MLTYWVRFWFNESWFQSGLIKERPGIVSFCERRCAEVVGKGRFRRYGVVTTNFASGGLWEVSAKKLLAKNEHLLGILTNAAQHCHEQSALVARCQQASNEAMQIVSKDGVNCVSKAIGSACFWIPLHRLHIHIQYSLNLDYYNMY